MSKFLKQKDNKNYFKHFTNLLICNFTKKITLVPLSNSSLCQNMKPKNG